MPGAASPLRRAADPYPTTPPRYEPVSGSESALTATTLMLLHHWFRHEPHTLGHGTSTYAFKYWPHQRRLVETFIYLYEVRGIHWRGYTARYFPDFIVRAKIGAVFHNFIVEVKGRLDDRDKLKAKRGPRWGRVRRAGE